MTPTAIVFTAREQAELLPYTPAALGADEIAGPALYSLISPGTELNQMYLAPDFPTYPGYATVFAVEQVGANVTDVQPGDLRSGPRYPSQLAAAQGRRHAGAAARLAARHCAHCAPHGRHHDDAGHDQSAPRRSGDDYAAAGPVGHLGAQVFQMAGYDVSVVEPDEYRRACLQQAGIRQIFPAVPVDDLAWRKTVDLVVECSGHERAALDACRIMRPTGELVLVGAPWQRHTDVNVQELLRLVFFNYLTLRSGWEWELPHRPGHLSAHSLDRTYATAARWLAEGRIYLDGFIETVVPSDAQTVYQDLLHGRRRQLFTMFDWR